MIPLDLRPCNDFVVRSVFITARNEVGARLYFHRHSGDSIHRGCLLPGRCLVWGGLLLRGGWLPGPGGCLVRGCLVETPQGRLLLWAVRILLECILVSIILRFTHRCNLWSSSPLPLKNIVCRILGDQVARRSNQVARANGSVLTTCLSGPRPKKKQFYLNIINVVLVLISCKYSSMSFSRTVGYSLTNVS